MTPTPGGEGKIKGLKRRLSPGYLRDTSHHHRPAAGRPRTIAGGKAPLHCELITFTTWKRKKEERGPVDMASLLPRSPRANAQSVLLSTLFGKLNFTTLFRPSISLSP